MPTADTLLRLEAITLMAANCLPFDLTHGKSGTNRHLQVVHFGNGNIVRVLRFY
ncbi:MAG: hypothetical protein ABSD53_23125 [Terriglobales bacterium]